MKCGSRAAILRALGLVCLPSAFLTVLQVMRSNPTRFPRFQRRIGSFVAAALLSGIAAPLLIAAQEDGPAPEAPDADSDAAQAEKPAPPIVVRASKLILRPGKVVENGLVLIQDGKIQAVGADVAVPEGATVVEGDVVCSGFMDPWSIAGLEAGSAGSSTSSASAMAADVVDPYGQEDILKELVAAGVLATRSQISAAANISGISVVLSTASAEPMLEDASLSASLGVTRSFGRGFNIGAQNLDPIDRVGQVDRLAGQIATGKKYGDDMAKYRRDLAEWKKTIAEEEAKLKKDFKKAKKARDKKVKDAKEKGEEVKDKKYKEDRRPKPPKYDAEKASFARAVNGEIPMVIRADRALEIRELLRLTKPYTRLRMILAGGNSALLCVDDLAARGIPVIVTPNPANVGGPVDELDPGLALAAELDAAGVEVLIGSGGSSALASRDLALLAALAVGHGLDQDSALHAITTGPARAFDVSGHLGSIVRGKAAELIVLSGDPLASSSRVLAAVSGGKVVYEAGN